MSDQSVLTQKSDNLQMPTDYRCTDNHLRLVLVVMLFAALGKAEPLISTAVRQKFESADGWTDGRYKAHYLPALLSYTVDKNSLILQKEMYRSHSWISCVNA